MLASVPARRDDAVAIVNGLFGDTLVDRDARLAIPMTLRAGDTVLPLDRDARRADVAAALAASGTEATSRICVFVHGLMITESIWAFPGPRRPPPSTTSGETGDFGSPPTTYGTRLAADHGVTPLCLRYNTGRHISTNGRQLAHLLARLIRTWPVRVREIDLVGHSMGGLVVRSACHYGRHVWPRGRHLPIGRRWTSKVRRVVLIGVPNTGAGLEALVNSASAALFSIPGPATRLLGRGLDRRSAGIKDLRFGAILDDDWRGVDPALPYRAHPHRPLQLPRAKVLLVAGTVTADPEHPVARRIGDTLVTAASATGQADDDIQLFPGATARLFPKLGHNALAHHPDVADAITSWW